MSHELRTPLTAIFGYTELLATGITGPVTPSQTTQLERIRSSAAHLLGIIEDILSFARAEAGREELREERVHLSGIVAEAVSLVQPTATQKQLPIVQTVRHDTVLSTDRGKVRQILVNLLSNAVKFTDEGRIEVIADTAGDQISVSVQDSGVGIAREDLQRVFEPFRQLQNATTRTVGGTGLGLAVSRRFAELLGGTITVESTVGQGSTFTLTIPKELPS
jgi:signal transduction histidine kinase